MSTQAGTVQHRNEHEDDESPRAGASAACSSAKEARRPHLREAYEAPLATLGATDPRVRTLTTEVYAQLQAARAQQNLPAALAWLHEATPVAEALHQAVHAAGQDLRLLAPPGENASRRHVQLLWAPVPRAHAAQQPVAVALATAREALSTRPRTLDALRASAPHQDRSPGVAAAASSAATAADELRTALRRRTLPSQPAPRLPHPAHRPQHPAPHTGLS